MSTTITWLGHSTVVLDVDGVRIVADPLLRRHAGLLRRRGGRPVPAQRPAPTRVGRTFTTTMPSSGLARPPAAPIITGAPNVPWLRKRNLSAIAPAEGEWIDVGGGAGVEVALTPAVHSSRPMPHRPNAANGHLVRTRSSAVWLAGDTELFDGLNGLPEIRRQAHRSGRRSGVRLGAPALGGTHGAGPGRRGVPARGRQVRRTRALGHAARSGRGAYPRDWMDIPGPAFARALGRVAPRCTPLVLEIGVPSPPRAPPPGLSTAPHPAR